jgi:integrative and conjugative element protein (TIGR02256 family)
MLQLLAHRQSLPTDREAGGILLGRLVDCSADIIVDEVSIPTPLDRSGRFHFLRHRKPAQQHVDKAWAESSCTRIYLGEWHTHPEDVPNPSGHDVTDWRRIVTSAKFEQESLFFVIVGRTMTCVWELAKQRGDLAKLEAL